MYMKAEGSSYEIEIEMHAWVSTNCIADFHQNEGNGAVPGT
jgi:hypothetical protein